ncbi:carboxyl transferase domain-containing protein [Pyxidicoccus sp. 3LG]
MTSRSRTRTPRSPPCAGSSVTCPRTAASLLPAASPAPPGWSDPELAQLVPERRRRAYDMRHVLRRLVDDGDFLELRPGVGRGLITALARLDGMPVGVIASQPLYQAGSLEPDACDKATRLVCLCDAFGLPLVLLQDTPGFLVGQKVEHARLLHKAMLFQQALVLAGVPKLTVVLRKAFGLAFFSLGGSGMGSDFLAAWPGAEIGFMDPEVAANVLMGGQVAELPPEEKRAQLQAVAGRIASATDPYGAATIMGLDEVIAPEDTRAVLVRQLRLHAEAPFQPGDLRPLSTWPTCW